MLFRQLFHYNCAGVGERFHVTFFTPTWAAYDRQFSVAVVSSWALGMLSAASFV